MRTKSFKMASPVSSSMMRSPILPPASPVATTGTSRSFSALAMLIPVPPASVRPALARCRWPRWKFGTVSVRSSAALSVTVTIKRPSSRRCGRFPLNTTSRAPRVPGSRPSEQRRGRAGDEPAPLEDAHLAERVAFLDGQIDGCGSNDALDEALVEACGIAKRALDDEVDLAPTVRRLGPCVDASGPDELDETEALEAVAQERAEIGVPLRTRRPTEQGRVHGHARPARGRHLRPARGLCMTGLDADQPRELAEQVVPRVQPAPARDRLRLLVDERADERLAHRDASELGHVARARDMAEDVEAVRPNEARVGEPPLSGSNVHDTDETGCVSPAHVVGERPGGVIGALDERRLDQVVDGDPLAGSEIDGRLADRSRRAATPSRRPSASSARARRARSSAW